MASSYSAEQFEQLLKCSVCLDRLNSPKILPCQHTFCKSPCIEGLIDWGSRRLKCPECRKEHFVPRDGADGYPNNITIMGFLDLPASRRPPAAAASADTSDAPAAAAPPAAAAVAEPASTTRKCGVCEEEVESLIKCFHCQKMVCSTCKQSHAGQIKLDIGRLINQIRRGTPKLANCISQVEGQAETVKQQVEGVKSQIRQTFETYIRELTEREKLLSSELDTFLQGELRSLRIQQENVEVELASISSYCDSTESLLNQSNSTPVPEADLASMKTQCAEYMSQIRQTESQPIVQPRKAAFRSDGSHIHANIRNLGEVTVQTPGGLRVTNSSNALGTVNNRSSNQLVRPTQPSTRAPPPPPVNAPTVTAPRNNYPRPTQPTTTAPPVNPPTATAPRLGYPPRPAHIAAPRDSWLDRELDDDFFRNFGIEPDDPPPRPHPAPSQDRRNRPSNVNPYMFRMPTHSAVTNSIDRAGEYWRRHLEAQSNRQRFNSTSIFGAASMFDNDEPPHEPEGFTDGSDRSSIPRRPIRTFHDDIPVGVAGRGGGAGRGVRGASEDFTSATSAPASYPARPAAAFMVPLDRETPVDLTHHSSENVSTTQAASPRRAHTDRTANRAGYRGSRSNPERNRARESNNHTRRSTTRETNSNNNTSSRNPDRERSNNRSERNDANDSSNNAQQAGITGDSDSNPRRVRPGTVVLSRGTRPLPTASQAANQNQSNSSDAAAASAAAVNENQNNANGDITSTSLTSATSSSTRQNTTAQSTIEATTDALNETLGDLLIDSEDEEEEEGEVHVTEIPGPQDSLTVANSLHRYELKQDASLQLGGERGNAPAQFACPRGVAVCPVSGSIIVADSSNHRIQVFSSAGQVIHHFGSYGQASGEFDCLAGVAVNLLGEIVVADRYNHRVQVFDRYGTFSHAFGAEGDGDGQLNYPWGIALDRSGFIYVCDKENNRVQMFQENGVFVRSISRLGSEEAQVENPHYVAVSEDNLLVVSDTNNHRIQVFTTTGRLVRCFGSEGQGDGQFQSPKGIAVDGQGFIIVADSGNHRVQVFRGNGEFFKKFGSEGTGPSQFKGMEGLAVTADGKIIVSDKENHRVQIF